MKQHHQNIHFTGLILLFVFGFVLSAFAGWDVPLSDSFSSFPDSAIGGTWNVSGSSGLNGWCKTGYAAKEGAYSAYCYKSSDYLSQRRGPYLNNMETYMSIGPFDLSNCSEAPLWFQYMIATEENWDKFGVYASIDGINFDNIVTMSGGDASTWDLYNQDLFNASSGIYKGQPQVWLMFSFTSDSSVTAEGVYFDDVMLSRNTTALKILWNNFYARTATGGQVAVDLDNPVYANDTMIYYDLYANLAADSTELYIIDYTQDPPAVSSIGNFDAGNNGPSGESPEYWRGFNMLDASGTYGYKFVVHRAGYADATYVKNFRYEHSNRPSPTVSSLDISGYDEVDENTTAYYFCTAFYSDGSSGFVSPTWTENSAYATIDSDGYLTTDEVSSDRQCTITATHGGQSDTHVVTIKNIFPGNTYYRDWDGDGYGNPNNTTTGSSAPSGYVSNNTDCDDGNANVHPGATEVCDSADNDCDGSIDEGVGNTYYRDADGDGYGNPNNSTVACSRPTGYVSNNNDCNDGNSAIRPGATEVCDGVDNDCDGSIDEGCNGNTYYRDADGDGYGNPNNTTTGNSAPSGYVSNNNDCNDSSAAIHPGATEVCDGVDNDCDGSIDEGCNSGLGLLGEYYSDYYLGTRVLTRTDASVNFDWGTGSPHASVPTEGFSVRWRGKITPAFSETYTFYTSTDDGVRLWVNGQIIIDYWYDQSETERTSASIALAGGQPYDIVMEYYENVGFAAARLLWSSASQSKQVVPNERLSSPTGNGDAYEPDDSADAAKAINNGQTQRRSIHAAGNKDWAKFTVGSKGARSVRLETAGTRGDTQMALYKGDGSNVAYDDNSGVGNFSKITKSSLSPGTYYIGISEYGNNGRISAYTLRATWIPVDIYESDNTRSTAKTISNGETQYRSIHAVGNVDWIKFTVDNSGAYNLRLETAGTSGDTLMKLYKRSGTRIASNDNGGVGNFSRIKRSSLPRGTYYIKVEERGNNSTIRAYTLKVSWSTP